jgi:hypothetical protein
MDEKAEHIGGTSSAQLGQLGSDMSRRGLAYHCQSLHQTKALSNIVQNIMRLNWLFGKSRKLRLP